MPEDNEQSARASKRTDISMYVFGAGTGLFVHGLLAMNDVAMGPAAQVAIGGIAALIGATGAINWRADDV